MSARYLVTGGQGFLGSYIVRRLLARGASVHVLDYKQDDRILKQVLNDEEMKQLKRVCGDIADFSFVKKVLEDTKPTNIMHLAALQVPACRADPLRGALVNVTGTLNIFEAVKRMQTRTRIVYASSAAVAGRPEDYAGPIKDEAPHVPQTHYGVFKIANEGNARIYWQDHKIPSVALRPHTVYGVGREEGITSGPTKAIKAAVLGKPYEIAFSGRTSFNYIEDVAEAFIGVSEVKMEGGAYALNIRGSVLDIEDFVRELIRHFPAAKGKVIVQPGASPLPIAYDFDQSGLNRLLPNLKTTELEDGLHKVASAFQSLKQRGLLDDKL